jgi:hypothetical protein
MAYFVIGVAQLGLLFSTNFPTLISMYGLVGVGDGIFFGCFTSVAVEVAGTSTLSNQAIGYLHLFLTLPVITGKILSQSTQ